MTIPTSDAAPAGLPSSIKRSWILPISLAILLIAISFHNYLLFHTLVELFSAVVAVLATVVVWQTYPFSRNNYLMYLGCGYIWIAALAIAHTVVYKGMAIYPDAGPNYPTQFWIANRYLEAFLLLSAPFFINRSFNRYAAISLFGLVAVTLFILIVLGKFPDAYIEGQGLTPFKITSEYVANTLLLGAIVYLWKRRILIDPSILFLMTASIILTICAGFAYTFYVSVYGLSNLAGHIFALFSFWLIFEAIISTTLKEPVRVMSRNLINEIEEHKQAETDLKYLATHDSLTGLYNRKVMEQRITDEILRAARYNHVLSVFMLDIDHFKQTNDTYGHKAGDTALSKIASIVESSIRKTDYVARYGGEEFAVVLPETPLSEAEELAERLRSQIADHAIPLSGDREINITASIGVATFPENAKTWDELLEAADKAMYSAKENGRNCVQTANSAG
ncbi:MAG: hypothetical protein DIZ77_18395 [endosymbiont of Seepiophila jonesi]|uniref:diguanylate cyclase n=1 Tax=endosymbiont of Lamellibrachia luymesi TaxID=2200907 RepID=A0A370DF11_9GAMM|nr:MAG: hypothetical protein DIZ79_17465 [endosymbiont of Lamellibrachia luymesi]RDH87304.1 MAG: hypothetical protein DIZ77_18395 [endosymbiont of Seepiophila jonesi]